MRWTASPKTENHLIPNRLRLHCHHLQNAVWTCFSHCARHTFATTVTLANGVPIETVSKMLGHTNIQTTQIYARVIDTKINNDMEALARKLNARSIIRQTETTAV